MKGGMAGVGADDKENTPARGTGKKGKERRSSGSGARRLSISGSKPRLHYLRVTNRFQRKGGFGRGRITAHRPVHFDGSPYEFSLRSDSEGDKRKSFVVFEDDLDSASSKSKQVVSAAELETTGKVLLVADSKNVTVENCRTPKSQGTVEQVASRAPVQQGSNMENFVAFRARNKSMSSAKLRLRPVASLVGSTNQQESSSRPSLEILAAKWLRGGRRNLFTQRLLDTSELEDLEQTFREMDEEDLGKKMHENNLEMELHKYDLEDVMQPRSQQEHEELFVSVKASDADETVMVPVEEQANVGELAPEPFITQRWELLSPRIGGLGTEGEGANVDLATPLPNDPKEKLRSDQKVPFSQATPVILELGVSPEASETDRAIKQQNPPSIKHLTPPAINQQTSPASLPFTGCNNQVLDTMQQVESEIAQTVEAVQVWSVELDPSRRRRETMQRYSNRRSPWIKSLVLSSFQSANQLPGTTTDNVLRTPAMSMDHFDRVTPFNVSRPLSPLSSSEFVLNGPTKNLVESYEGGFPSTNLPSSSGEGMNGKEGDAEITDGRYSTCPDHTTTNEFEAHVPSTGNDQDMQALKDSEATLRNSRSSWPDQSPVTPIDLSAQRIGDLHERTSESSLEPPPLQSPEPLRRVDDVKAIPALVETSFDTIRASPTPPRNISLFFGNPFGQMSGEELSRRWLQFCITPPVFSDAIAGKKKSWNVESAFVEPTCSDPTASFPSEQVLQRTTEADVLPIAEEEAVSSDGLGGKTSMHDEGVLPNAEEEAVSSDGLGGKTSMHDEGVLPNAEEEAVSSDGLGGKTSMHDEGVLPNAEEEAVSSDGLGGKTSMHDEGVLPNAEEEAVSSDGLGGKTSMHDEGVLPNAEEEAVSSDGLGGKTSMHDEGVLPNAEEEAVSSDGLGGKTSMHDEGVLPNAEDEALSSDGSDGVMDYENDFDDISNDTTCIVQTGASSAVNDQEGTSALKESPQEDAPDALFGEELRCISLTPLRDNNFVETITGPAVEYSLTHIDEEHIDQFMNCLQLTPGVDDSCVERSICNGEGVSRDSTVTYNCQSPGDKAGQLNVNKELITPEKDGNKLSAEAQDECTPVQKKPKTKRTRNSTRLKKVDSPLDAGSKWSNGQRMSTRIRSKPLDWWRGERMLYGRVHSTLNTLIGIKHLSPDPVWPRPRDRKNKVDAPKFKVDSFVSDEHKELLRLAAQ